MKIKKLIEKMGYRILAWLDVNWGLVPLILVIIMCIGILFTKQPSLECCCP